MGKKSSTSLQSDVDGLQESTKTLGTGNSSSDQHCKTCGHHRFGGPWTATLLITVLCYVAVFKSLAERKPDCQRANHTDQGPLSFEKVAREILSGTPLIDGHNDLAFLIRAVFGNQLYSDDFTHPFETGGMPYHVDLPRLKSGLVGGAFWSAFVICPSEYNGSAQEKQLSTVKRTQEQIDLIHRLTASYSHILSNPVSSPEEAIASFKQKHKLISPIGIEGLHQIGESVSNLRLYHHLGVRFATLTHNCHNSYADAALVKDPDGTTVAAPPYHGGLSKRGQSLVREMNRMGMLVDLAHVSHDTMRDVLGGNPEKFSGSRAPLMFSHSSAFSICPHPRNVPDDVLKLVKQTDSIVMVNFCPEFISCVADPNSRTGLPRVIVENATLHQVARHVMYIGELIGYEHVGLGSDFDGIPSTPKGLEDVSKFPDLVVRLLELGLSRTEVEQIVGGNIIRVWQAAEEVGTRLRKEGVLPLEDEIGELETS